MEEEHPCPARQHWAPFLSFHWDGPGWGALTTHQGREPARLISSQETCPWQGIRGSVPHLPRARPSATELHIQLPRHGGRAQEGFPAAASAEVTVGTRGAQVTLATTPHCPAGISVPHTSLPSPDSHAWSSQHLPLPWGHSRYWGYIYVWPQVRSLLGATRVGERPPLPGGCSFREHVLADSGLRAWVG